MTLIAAGGERPWLMYRSRAEHLARAVAAEGQGRLSEARDCYTKCVDITPEMAYQLIKVGLFPALVSCSRGGDETPV